MPPVLSLLILTACTPVDHSGPWGEIKTRRADALQEAIEAARAEQDLTGLAMAVAFHDEHTLWVSAVGDAHLEPQEDWQVTHRSRIGSVTKTFTTALIFQHVESGILTLDDPIEQWVPGWYTGVTIAHLLGHSSGIVSYNYVGNFDTSRAWMPDELVQWAWDHEPQLRFTPGSQWEYSNTNYVLLGLILESATGQTFEALLSEALLTPLGLTDTMLDDGTNPDVAELVSSYSEPPVTDMSGVDPSFGWSAGGMVSTPTDLVLWSDALFLGDLLTPASLEAMTTPQGLTGPDESEYGLGAFYESDGEYTIWGHTGGIAGYLTYAFTMEDPAVSLVVMTNQLGVDLRAASGHGWAAVLDIELP